MWDHPQDNWPSEHPAREHPASDLAKFLHVVISLLLVRDIVALAANRLTKVNDAGHLGVVLDVRLLGGEADHDVVHALDPFKGLLDSCYASGACHPHDLERYLDLLLIRGQDRFVLKLPDDLAYLFKADLLGVVLHNGLLGAVVYVGLRDSIFFK